MVMVMLATKNAPVFAKGNGIRNKRIFLSENILGVRFQGSPLPLVEFPKFNLLEVKLCNALGNFESSSARSDQHKEEEVKKYLLADWNDPTACQLEDLLLDSLFAIFESAIKKIAEYGYSEEVAERVVLRSGLYYGDKDALSNIENGALAILRSDKGFRISRHHLFEDLESLVEYTMLEMVHVLLEVKPSLSVVEAMWCLLICDLNLAHACAMEGDVLSVLGGKEVSTERSSESILSQFQSKVQTSITTLFNPSKPHISELSNPDPQMSQWGIQIPVAGGKSVGITGGHIQPISQTIIMEDKSRVIKKGDTGNSKRDILRQRALHIENYRRGMSKGTFKAKHTSLGGLALEKKQKSPTNSSGAFKNASSKVSTAVLANAPPSDGNHHLSCNPLYISPSTDTPATLPTKDAVSAIPVMKTKIPKSIPPDTKPPVQPQSSIPLSLKNSEYYTGILYDKFTGKYVPQNAKDKKLLALVTRMQTLQKELQNWTDWLIKKVMQAARRLGKDQAELRLLRQEKEEEKITKEQQILEEITMKRLSERECALDKAPRKIDMANSTVSRLEPENSVLKMEMNAARIVVSGSSAELRDAMFREQEILKKVQSCDLEKGLLLEELTTFKQEASGLQKSIEKTKGLYNQSEAPRKQEGKVKVKLLSQASSIRKEKEWLYALSKEEGDEIRQKAEIELQKYTDKIKELEAEISKLKLESESSKMDAFWRGISLSYGSAPIDSTSTPALQGYLIPKVRNRLPVFWDLSGAERVKQGRECV